jgi:hypothetical protein
MTETPEDIILDLWIAVYGEPLPVRAELSTMIGALVSGLPEPDRVFDGPAGSTRRFSTA